MRRVFRLPFTRASVARAVDDELAFHLEMRMQKLVASGMAPEAACREALRQFGNVSTIREYCVTMDQERDRAMQRAHLLDELRQDFIYALRTLRRTAGVSLVIVLTLALGIGANTTVFTLVNAVLLRPLPVHDPERLVAIGDPRRVYSFSDGGVRTDLLSYPLYRDIRMSTTTLSGVAATGRTGRVMIRLDGTATPERVNGRFVSGNYFRVLGVPAFIGRVFDGTEDATIGGSPIIVVSHAYWMNKLGADPRAVGRTMLIEGVRFTIVGVAPATFEGEIVGDAIEVWLPLTMQAVVRPAQNLLADRTKNWLIGLGRLQPGASLQEARSELRTLIPNLIGQNASRVAAGGPANVSPDSAWVSSGARGISSVRGSFTTPLLTLMAGTGLLLLIICTNVATLLLARAVARGREMGVRLAIGAGRSRLVRQLLTESLLLAFLSASTGLLLAWYGSALLLQLSPEYSGAVKLDTSLDARVLGFTIGLSVLCVGVFGLVPALRASRIDLASAMRERATGLGSTSIGVRGQRVPIGRLLITGQVALSLVLLFAAVLLGRSLRSVEGADVGLDREHLLIVDVDALGRGYREERLALLTRELSARVQRIPGVTHVSFSENGIFSGTESGMNFQAPGFVPRTQDDSTIYFDQIGPGYVRAIGGRLLQGREFTDADDVHASRVAILNASAARYFFGTTSPVGQIVRVEDVPMAVVGVIGDVRDHSLVDPTEPRIYVPFLQRAVGDAGTLRLIVRTSGDPASVATAVRSAVTAQDKLLVVWRADPLSRMMSRSIGEQRLVARLATAFGVLALLLAAIGLYGVMTYAVTRRTGEIGLRVALGAQRSAVLRMVLVDAMRLVALGILFGVPLAIACTQLLRSQLHGVSTTDPAAIAVALMVLAASGVLATLIPALRASRVPPLVALRQE